MTEFEGYKWRRISLEHIQRKTTRPPKSLETNSRAFYLGWYAGVHNEQNTKRYNLDGLPTEDGLIEIVTNLCELYAARELMPETLRYDVGLIAGWLYRIIPPAACTHET